MIIEKLDLADRVYSSLEGEAVERGITVEELIRWVLGDHTRYNLGTTILRPLSTSFPQSQEESEGKEVLKLSGMFMKAMINRGAITCRECTQPLNLEEIENGKCSKCGAEI